MRENTVNSSKPRRVSRKKKAAIALVAVGALGIGGAAYAYWTSGGTGTGTAATAEGADALEVNQDPLPIAMFPGIDPQVLSGDFDNPGPNPVYVTTVTVSIVSVTGGVGGCNPANYELTDEVMDVNDTIAFADGTGEWTGATIAMVETGVSQDECKGATVNLLYTVA